MSESESEFSWSNDTSASSAFTSFVRLTNLNVILVISVPVSKDHFAQEKTDVLVDFKLIHSWFGWKWESSLEKKNVMLIKRKVCEVKYLHTQLIFIPNIPSGLISEFHYVLRVLNLCSFVFFWILLLFPGSSPALGYLICPLVQLELCPFWGQYCLVPLLFSLRK